MSSDDIDPMAITRPHTGKPGHVIWLAGGVIDTFPGFDEWFVAMIDYNRRDYRYLVEKHGR